MTSPTVSSISVGIVGAGRMGRHHATNLAGLDDVKILGVADVEPALAEALAEEHGAAAFRDYREMLDRTRPDVVYLCTPATDHLEQVTYAAERGINIFVEKPLATNVTDAFAIADVVERHGVICSVGYQWRYSPVADAAREALGDSPITLLAGWWYWTIPLIGWIRDRRLGGGQIFDQATHLIDLMRYLAGDVSTVYATYASNAVPQADLPNWDANSVSLGFHGGAVGSVHSTYALFPGIADGNGLDVVARELLVRISLERARIFRPDTDPVDVVPRADWNITRSFLPIVRRNDPGEVRATAREAAESIAVSLAANYSAETGKVVDLRSFVARPPTDVPIMPA